MEIIKSKNYTYSEMTKGIRALKETYPFIEVFSIGQSCMGRELPAIKIGKSDKYCLYTAAFHGSESLTTSVMLLFCEELCKSLAENILLDGINTGSLLNDKGIIIVPRVNPDGCEISLCGASAGGIYAKNIRRISGGDTLHWNSNLRGVDINHNFSAGWQKLREMEKAAGIYGPSKTRYGGPYPESEPETSALVCLCEKVNISHAVAFHSQGEVIYWRFGDKIPVRSQKIVALMENLSGYKADEPTGLAVGGGFKDWFIDTFNRPAFTVELGLGENPLPETSAQEIYGKVRKMLTALPLILT